ncbi:MAG: hypothetical protein FWD13_07655 [Treponema sp.]|nr:hypothetical protein [Treponema sp.]
MDKIKNNNAKQILNMCAYFAPDKIPVNIFVRGKDALPSDLKKNIEDDLKRNIILNVLTRHSLLKCEKEHDLLSKEKRVLYMHRLLQEVIQNNIGTDYSCLAHCLNLMQKVIDWKDYQKESIASFRLEAPHAIAVAEKSSVIISKDYEIINNVVHIFYGNL